MDFQHMGEAIVSEQNIHAPGIYFGMPEEEYFADDSLSNSGIKQIAESPLTYWTDSNMNEAKEEEDDAKKHLIFGKAFHAMILEGECAFNERFYVMPAKSDYGDLVDGGKELKALCSTLGLKVSGSIKELCDRILAVEEHNLWPVIEEEAKEDANDRDLLTRKQYLEIMTVKKVIDSVEDTKNIFPGGAAEVSVFWVWDGVPMKCRMDKLKPMGIIDLKSFANRGGKEVSQSVAGQVSSFQYYTQPPVYLAGLKAACEMYAEQGLGCIHGDILDRNEDPTPFLDSILASKFEQRFWFVFIQKGGVPNVIVRAFDRFENYGRSGMTENSIWRKGQNVVDNGLHVFRKFSARFKDGERWVTDFGIRAFTDADFPMWVYEESQDTPETPEEGAE